MIHQNLYIAFWGLLACSNIWSAKEKPFMAICYLLVAVTELFLFVVAQ